MKKKKEYIDIFYFCVLFKMKNMLFEIKVYLKEFFLSKLAAKLMKARPLTS